MLTKTKPRFEYLEPYGINDQDFFQGRDQEVDRLYEMVFESNVILVCGMPKTGKTSLVDCGLANRFSPANCLLVRVRRNNDLNKSLRESLIAKLKELPEGVENYSLGKLLYCLFLTYLKPIYLVFDQFEEIYLDGEENERRKFIADLEQVIHRQKSKTWRDRLVDRISRSFEIATELDHNGKKSYKKSLEKFKTELDLIRKGIQETRLSSVEEFLTELDQLIEQKNPQKAEHEIRKRLQAEEYQQETDTERSILANLNCKVILIMRQEYISLLDDFEEKVPELVYNKLRLEPMTNSTLIKKVIPGLCKAASMSLVDESEVGDKLKPIAADIIQQVKNNDGFVNLSYLNFYLKTLWDNAIVTADGTRNVTRQLVSDTGHVQYLLKQLLELQKKDVVIKLRAKYPEITLNTVGEILSEFVTQEGNSKPRNQEEIRIETIDPQLIADCLGQLEDANIVRRMPYGTLDSTGNQFVLVDIAFAKHIHKAWNEPQRRYFYARSIIQDAYEAYETSLALNQSSSNPSLELPDTSLTLILPHEKRLKAELQPEVWDFWLLNKKRIEDEIRSEVKSERLIKMLLWGTVLLMVAIGFLLIIQIISLREKKRQLAQTEGNRLLQLLDNSEDLSRGDSTTYNIPNNPVYDNPSLKYRIALSANSVLPDNNNKSRAKEWLTRLEPMGIPFYNLSIDAHGALLRAGFLPDGRIFALSSDPNDPAQVWKLLMTDTTSIKTEDTSGNWKIPPSISINEPKYGTTEAKAKMRKNLKGETNELKYPLLAISKDTLLRVRRGPTGSVRVYKGPTNSSEEILLTGHQVKVTSASFWKDTTTTTGMTLLLTADSTGIIRVYNTTNFCFESKCLAELLPAEKSDLALELTEEDLQQLALSRDWSKLSQYLFKLENHYHELGQTHHAGLDSIVNRLSQPELLAKQTPGTLYRFWRKVVSLTKAEVDEHSKTLYATMEAKLKTFMLKWPLESVSGKALVRIIASSENRLDLLFGVRFLEAWVKPGQSPFSLREYIYNRAIMVNALEPIDKKAYLDFARKLLSLDPEKHIVWVIYNLSQLSQQRIGDEQRHLDGVYQKDLQEVTTQVRQIIRNLSDQSFRGTSQVELVLSVVDDTLWSGVRIAEYKRRMADNSDYYQKNLVEAYSNLAYYQWVIKNYKASINSAWHGINQPAPEGTERDYIYTNLATAYLLKGQFKDAKVLYSRFKERDFTIEGKTHSFRKAFLEDLDVAEQKGIIRPERQQEVAEIRQLLNLPNRR